MSSPPEDALAAWLETVSAGALDHTVRPSTMALLPTVAAANHATGPTRAGGGLDAWVGSLPRIGLEPAGASGSASCDLELGELLGEGGMGLVYEARQASLDRKVAVKLVRDDRPDASGSLLREARLSGALEHPGIVPVHALGATDDGRPVLVMKRVEGTSWQDLLDQPEHPAWAELATFPAERLLAHLEILSHVASTLAFAHARGIIHRDVKPANVLVGRFGEVYLVDWGIALDLSRRDDEPVVPVGTPMFLAPEMLLGDPRDVDERTDVYLLGATLHAVLARSPRHGGTTMREVLQRAERSEPVVYGPEIPAELAALANLATSRDPSARPASALAFRERLHEYFEHRGSIELTARGEQILARARLSAAASASSGPEASAERRLQLAEARFAFEQALAQWRGNEPARSGLREVLEHAVELELAEGALGAARALLASSPVERDELAARIGARERELSRLREEDERLRRAARRHNPRREAGTRTLLLLVLTLGAAGLSFVMREARMGDDPYTSARSPVFPLAVCVAFAPFLWLGRRAIRESAFNRNLVGSIGLTLLLAAGLRLVGFVARTPIAHVMAFELLLFSALMGFLGLFVARVFFWAFAVSVLAAAAAVLLPDQLEAFYVLSPLSLAVASHYAGRRAPSRALEEHRPNNDDSGRAPQSFGSS